MIISTDWMQIAFQRWLTKHLDKADKIEQEQP